MPQDAVASEKMKKIRADILADVKVRIKSALDNDYEGYVRAYTSIAVNELSAHLNAESLEKKAQAPKIVAFQESTLTDAYKMDTDMESDRASLADGKGALPTGLVPDVFEMPRVLVGLKVTDSIDLDALLATEEAFKVK